MLSRLRRHCGAASRRTLFVAALAASACLLAPRTPALGDLTLGGDLHQVGAIPLQGCGLHEEAVDTRLGVFIDIEDTTYYRCVNQPHQLKFRLFSTRTLQQVGGGVSALAGQATTTQVGDNANLVSVDTVRHRLFVVIEESFISRDVKVFDLASMLGRSSASLSPEATLPIPSTVAPTAGTSENLTGPASDFSLFPFAMQYDAAFNAVDVVLATEGGTSSSFTSTNGPKSSDVYVIRLDSRSGSVRWTQLLGRCVDHLPGPTPLGSVQTPQGEVVMAACLYVRGAYPGSGLNGGDTTASVEGGSAMVYAIHLAADGMPAGNPASYLGRSHAYGGMVDSQDGRAFVASLPPQQNGAAATAAGPAAVTFDLAHGAFIAASTVGDQANATIASAGSADSGFAMTSGGGRFYAVSPLGIRVLDATATPPGEGQVFPVFSCFAAQSTIDPGTRRLAVLPYHKCLDASSGQGSSLLVFEDDSDGGGDGQAVAPDSYTRDIAEVPGVTQSTFSGHGSGTGTRVRLVGGSAALLGGATFGGTDVISSVYGSELSAAPNPFDQLDYANHELDIARVASSDLDNFQANAAAIAASVDDSTGGAVSKTGQKWPFKEVSCTASSAKPSQPSPDNVAGNVADVSCDTVHGVTTHVEAGPLALTDSSGLALGSGSSEVRTSTARTSEGMATTVTSTVHGIVLGPIEIQAVTTTATCTAHGRPHTASCTFSRSITGVTNAGVAVAGGGCTDASSGSCATLIAELNAVRPDQLVFSAPPPDQRAGYLDGSPGGYQAVAQRDLYQYLQDRTLNYDNSLETPGLDVLYVNDTAKNPSRIDLQFAEVTAQSHYGITPADQFVDLGGGGGVAGVVIPEVQPPATASPAEVPTPTQNVPTRNGNSDQSPGAQILAAFNRVWDGLRLLARSPGTALLMACFGGLLLSPLAIARRRRVLQGALREEVG